eukprot:gb/GFBE01047730.1/.p1 GENE.gb/GFBE01047730.1/~~gb/GFBE01047730.1/.p1  ORF type:complete len:103 (+),score=19.02 gb/GFBE01047730.1/:1-309(+)
MAMSNMSLRSLTVDSMTSAMFHFILAMLFASAAVALLNSAGWVNKRPTCDASGEYGLCAALQDLRVIVSFTLGVVTCKVLEPSSNRDSDSDCKGNIYACLLW